MSNELHTAIDGIVEKVTTNVDGTCYFNLEGNEYPVFMFIGAQYFRNRGSENGPRGLGRMVDNGEYVIGEALRHGSKKSAIYSVISLDIYNHKDGTLKHSFSSERPRNY